MSDPRTIRVGGDIIVNGSPLGDLWDDPKRTKAFVGQIFNMSTDGRSSVGETVSVLMVGSTPREVERVERGPYGDRLAVWWSGEDAPAVFSPDADGWPEVERVSGERPCR